MENPLGKISWPWAIGPLVVIVCIGVVSWPKGAAEQQLAGRLLAFERLSETWPRGRTAIERAEIGRQLHDRGRLSAFPRRRATPARPRLGAAAR